MKRILKVFLLLFGVMIYSQNTLSVKDGAYGYNTDFKLDIHLATDTAIKALQFDLKYDGDNFDYKSTFDLTKSRLGGEDSDHVITVKEVKSGNLRILIYSPSNKVIPNGDGELLKIDFSNTKKYAIYPFELVSVVASKEDNTNLSLELKNGNITTLASHVIYYPSSIDLESVYKDTTPDFKWTISNDGTDTLNVTLSENKLTKFTLTQWDDKTTPITWPLKIFPAGEQNYNTEINVRVDSSANGTFEESLFLDSDDPDDSRKGVKEIKFKAKVYNENRVIVQSGADAENDKVSDVNVSINGDEDITSFQFDIYPNQNINVVSGSAALLKSGTDHIISSNVRTDSESGNKFLRVVAYSPSNALLTQPIGEIVKFSVKPEKIVNPGFYNLDIKDVVLTNKDLTNVSSASENGSINLITGRLGFNSPVVSDNVNRVYDLDLGEIFRNSYNEKVIPYTNDGNKKLTITSVSSNNPELTISDSFPVEKEAGVDSNLNIKVIPTGDSNSFSAYVKFNHDGGSELDSIQIRGTVANRNILVVRNSNVEKGKVNTVPISMLNSNKIKGMQFDLTLPKETKSFTWTLTADSNEDFSFSELDNAKDPGITHYVGDEINFNNNSGGTHPLFIVTGLSADGGYDATKQLAGVTNQGATSGNIKVDLSEVSPGTYYYICGNHKSMQGVITVRPKFAIDAKSSDLISERSADFTLTQSSLGARKYRFLLFSGSNSFFTGNYGAIINMPIEVKDISNSAMAVADGAYDVTIDNLLISGEDNSNIASEPTAIGKIIVGGSNQFNPVVDPNQTTTLKENPALNTYFYKIKASDADDYSFVDDYKIVSGNDDGSFGVIPETGDLYVLKPENIDYETKTSYSIGVTVSDGEKISSEESITINIIDDPNAYVVKNFTIQVYRDNEKSGSSNNSDGNKESSSESSSDFLYQIDSGSDKDLFTLDSSSGKLSLDSSTVFSNPADTDKNNIYEVSIKTIAIDDRSDNVPVITSERTISIKEGTINELNITSILATDASDVDRDGIIDSLDNCPLIANSNQRDFDKNGEGDVCEDSDGDGVLDNKDVCPIIPNADQADADFDGIGDVCEDSDGDGVNDIYDNCINTPNLDQKDFDDDGIGDVCDDDRDGDGKLNSEDNCPDVPNADQADSDGDGIGDVCDNDRDGDGVVDTSDNCQTVANADQADMDEDGIGDVCDDDKDGDGKLNIEDNCPDIANANQADMDEDGIGDVCDDDRDGDGKLNTEDNCPNVANADQADADKDGIGDVCDSVFNIPFNNNKVEVTSASCIGNADGSIGLSVEDNSFDYSITVTGKDDPIAITGENKTASVTGLSKGDYTVCFKVTVQADYEQCFEVTIGEPKALSAFIDVDNDNRSTTIQLGGSKDYNVDINGERFKVTGDNFTSSLKTGLNSIRISTGLDCQGMIEREVFISEDIHYCTVLPSYVYSHIILGWVRIVMNVL